MIQKTTRTVIEYRVVCQAAGDCPQGCSGTGPWGHSVQESRELATESGWTENWQGRWICPGHAGVADDTPV